MPKKDTSVKVETAKTLAPNRGADKALVREIMAGLFESGEFEIPDDCVVGKVSAKIANLEAQVKSLTARLAEVQARSEGKPNAVNRADALAKGTK